MIRALVLALGVLMAADSVVAQPRPPADPSIAPPGWKPPRNAMGQPDLSGFWTNATMTPITRNRRHADRATLTDAEAREMEKIWGEALAASDAPTDPDVSVENLKDSAAEKKLLELRPDFGAAGGDTGGYNSFWLDPGANIMRVNGQFRTSILTTPNGQPPPRKAGAPAPVGMGYRDVYDSHETRNLGERCIMGFGSNAGPPMLANGYYNNGYYFLQTPDAVAIQVEMIHEVRNVRLNSRHRTDGIRPWMGDSIGRYEGDTLVVETINIPERQAFMGSWKNLKVTEWFTRVSPTRVHYRFQIEDPDTWETAWGGEYNFAPMNGVIYEYACHEGNYSLPGILGGARKQEADARAAATSAPGSR